MSAGVGQPLPAVVRTVPDLRRQVSQWRRAGDRIALVPTMGALHEGHLALVRLAAREARRVVVSIFVNPKQFGPREDFSRYPRDEAADLAKLAGLAELVYAPPVEAMYPEGFSTTVSVSALAGVLEGEARPGHFDGMATVVAKLLLQCGPDVAVFGEKDWQQLQIVKRLVRDLDLPLEILGHPVVRDAHGLALSSRNAYLPPEALGVARRLNRVLLEVRDRIARDGARALEGGTAALRALGFGPIDYLALCDAETLLPVERPRPGRPARLLVAAKLGAVRLVDTIPVEAD